MENDLVRERAKQNIEEGEEWHKRTNVREIVFGFNDGTISTLALLAGVTGAALSKGQILIAGLSGVVAGAISMAIGAYISSKSETEHHKSEIRREEEEIEEVPEVEREELRLIYEKKANFTPAELELILNRLTENKQIWLDVMMKEELGLFEERFENPFKVGFIMLGAFLAGGIIPVAPFFFLIAKTSLIIASALTFASLFMIGVWKTTFTERKWFWSGLEMVLVGILATVVPYLIGDLFLSWMLQRFLGG
jgi:VIT1/CCC1 family predicted Fe2+/Mn2+ transporter